MKFIFPISVTVACLFSYALGTAVESSDRSAGLVPAAEQHLKRAVSFLKNAGTPVQHSPSLRTENTNQGETLHLQTFSDSACTVPLVNVDLKLNHCSPTTGYISISDKAHNTWTVSVQEFDGSCETPSGSTTFARGACTAWESGYAKMSIIGEPKKSIPGGGNAVAFYDTADVCHGGNLHRASSMVTWPNGVCANVIFSTDGKAASCDANQMVFHSWDSSDQTCSGNALADFPIPLSLSCGPFGAIRFLCVADSTN